MSHKKDDINVQAIVLAGGLGTRLQSVVSDVPKCMAPVEGIPFIHFIISWLKNEGVKSFILSLGYKSEIVIEYITKNFADTEIEFVIEDHPLGTGGAIKLACGKATTEDVVIVNGDTLFNINIERLVEFHQSNSADFTCALKQMYNFSRYGSVEIDDQFVVKAFNEKKLCERGFINGGIYVLKTAAMQDGFLPQEFSFEKDFLEKQTPVQKFIGLPCDNYFIDIGIPDDYSRFQNDYHLLSLKQQAQQKKANNNSGGINLVEIVSSFLNGLSEIGEY